MIKNEYLQQAVNDFSDQKADKELLIPGLLGINMNGAQRTICANRPGYVWVRLHGSSSEFIQAYNDVVVPIYGMPVLVSRNPIDKSRYYVVSDKDAHAGVLGTNSTYMEYWDDTGSKRWTGNPSLGQVLTKATSTLQWVSRNHPKWFTTGKTHANWDGDAQGTGSTTFAVSDFNSDISSGATAILVYMQARWDTADENRYVALYTTGGDQAMVVRSQVANIRGDASGIVPLDASHQFTITINGAATDWTYILVKGYWYTL